MSPSQRGLLLHRVGDLIARDAKRLAEFEVRDNGKLMAEMFGQCEYLLQWHYYFGGLADKIQGAVAMRWCLAAITPWNSPLLLATWKIAPALAAGCTVVVKPSEFTSASTIEFAKLFTEAGFPPGVVNVVTGFGKDVGSPLVEHPLVKKITFTDQEADARHHHVAYARNCGTYTSRYIRSMHSLSRTR